MSSKLSPERFSHGSGAIRRREFGGLGRNVIFERGAMVFHPENIVIGDNVYVGHYAILKGYHKNKMEIGDGTWIGQMAFLHSAGGLRIGKNVGIGPGVIILTSQHDLSAGRGAILHRPLQLRSVVIEDGADIGAGSIVLPGVRIGRRAQVGAGAVVTADVPANSVVAGVPARRLHVKS